MNVQSLAFHEFQVNATTAVPQIFVLGPDMVPRFPRLTGYNAETNRAEFLMVDALPNGVNMLHVSGPGGLGDVADHPLDGSSQGQDYLASITVDGPARGSGLAVDASVKVDGGLPAVDAGSDNDTNRAGCTVGSQSPSHLFSFILALFGLAWTRRRKG